ncbi:MAG: hypothetical protein U1E73_07235 [Planctomycetota bacterium]
MRTLAVKPNGDVVAAGDFQSIGGVQASNIALRDAGGWRALGSGVDGIVTDVAIMANGDLVVVGGFQNAGGNPAQGVARWDGSTWSPLGAGIGTPYGANCVEVGANGHVYVGGFFQSGGTYAYLGEWDGATWSYVPCNSIVHGLARLPNGDLVAAGGFTSVGGAAANYVARFDGSSWQPMGAGFSSFALRVAVTGDGTPYVLGSFAQAEGQIVNGIARWDGAHWHGVGGGVLPNYSSVLAAMTLPGGDLIVGGSFDTAGGVAAPRLARWNGTAWSAFGSPDSWVSAMAMQPDGSVLLAGNFVRIGGIASAYLAGLTSTCAASAASLGGGCPSSGGNNDLVATALPWVGSTFRAQATGVPTSGFVVAVTGFLPAAVPLASVLPQGVAGCDLLTTADITQLVFASGGIAHSALPLPNAAVLAGFPLRHQLVPCELGSGGSLAAVTSSNVLALSIGSF